jgi:pre-mRNA-processing factor SLU7
MGHKQKDCLYRQRKIGAKFTGTDIKADERGQDIDLGWEAKRDRWSGYDASAYQEVVDEYNDLQAIKDAKRKTTAANDEEEEEEEEDENNKHQDGDKYEEETDMGRKQPNSSRNLRLREDTAGYLKNLDLESAKYDPKTRTLLDDPEGEFQRASGDADNFARAQRYAWETAETSGQNNMHLQANPTAGEHYRKKEEEANKKRKEATLKSLQEKYGLQPSSATSSRLLTSITANEKYTEYDAQGRVKNLMPPPESTARRAEKSMYTEDVFPNNHTSVFGSWWRNFQWGYACCHSTTKQSYCVGDAGKQITADADILASGSLLLKQGEVEHEHEKKVEVEHEHKNKVETEQVTVVHTQQHKRRNDQQDEQAVEKKRRLNDMVVVKNDMLPSEDQMEEYRKTKNAANDPMAAFVGKD